MIKNSYFRNILKILKCFFILKNTSFLKKTLKVFFLTLKNAFENMPFFVLNI